MEKQDGYKYQGVPVENLKIDDGQAKAKELEANGGKVKTRQPKSPKYYRVKVIAALLLAVILLVAIIALVILFDTRDTKNPVFVHCPHSVNVTVYSLSDEDNVTASWERPEATDNTGIVNIASSHKPGDTFQRDSTTEVTYVALDPTGNEAKCSFYVSVIECAIDEWRCKDGECITDSLVCDGTPHCKDRSDEHLCEDCLDDSYLLPCDETTKCLPTTFMCDGIQHCDDFEDEKYCDNCEELGYFSCLYGGQCYRPSDACNNVIDCLRFRDEYNCYECSDIPLEKCRDVLPYNSTFFPSLVKTAEEAIDIYMDFDSFKNCHGDLELFLCGYLFPECSKHGTPWYVCSDFCQEVQDACSGPYAAAMDGQELNLFCDRYPQYADSTETKLCKTTFQGCNRDVATTVNITDGLPHVVISPNYPMAYPNAFDCRWIFIGSEGKHIRFRMLDLSLSDDNLLFGPGEEVDIDMATYYYRNDVLFGKWLVNVTITESSGFLQLRANSAGVSRGFKIEVIQFDVVNVTCRDDQWHCEMIGCIDGSRICDGLADCYDESDEYKCEVCPYYDMVKCGDGSCIHRIAVCDDFPDCDDDEANCTFECDYGSVFLNDWLVCDSFNDCGDHSDELQNCECVEEREFSCGERCIPNNYLCDGMADCADGSDEINCTCTNWKRPCDDGACLPFWMFCDNTDDCLDGSDEKECQPCAGNFFQCENKECVSADGICDGYLDCSDLSDEKNCDDVYYECGIGTFSCKSDKQCLPEESVCDGVRNCARGEDELDCDKTIKPQDTACGVRYINLTTATPAHTLIYPSVVGLSASCTWLITSPPGTVITVIQSKTITCCGTFMVGHGHDPTDFSMYLEIYSIPDDDSLVSRGNEMWVTFETELNFLTFELLFKSVTKVCNESEVQCYSKFDRCISQVNWCDSKPDCDIGEDETRCIHLESQEDTSTPRRGVVKVTMEGSKRYLCYDIKTWSDTLGNAICNQNGFGFLNESGLIDIVDLGSMPGEFYIFPVKALRQLLSLEPYPFLYTIAKSVDNCPSGNVIWVSCEEPVCGRQGRMPRVVSGRDAVEGEVPWMVSLSHPMGDTLDHYCGASLISNKWVLTAGHCVDGFPLPNVLVGTTNITSETPYRQLHRVRRSVLFPTYSNFNLNDIGLLELETAVVITDRVRPICLPPSDDSLLTDVGRSATMTGWGGTIPFGSTPLALQTARASILDTESCKNFEDPTYISDNVVCCMNIYGEQNSCKGDSGGPLFVQQNGSWYQIGIVSRGGTPSCSAPRQTVIYTRVAKFLNFIQEYVHT